MSAIRQEEENQGRRNQSQSPRLEIVCRWTRAFRNLLENKGRDLITQDIFFKTKRMPQVRLNVSSKCSPDT